MWNAPALPASDPYAPQGMHPLALPLLLAFSLATAAPHRATLAWANDYPAGTDRHYTNGLKLSLGGALPAQTLPFLRTAAGEWELTLGHEIYTPGALRLEAPPPADRPYAGWLYLSLSLTGHDREATRSHTFGLDLGLAGPASGAEALQRATHRVLDSIRPRGWNHQLPAMVGGGLRYELEQRLARGRNRLADVELAWQAGVALGNVQTRASAGVVLRWGLGVPDRYAPDPPRDLRLYLATAAEVRLVGRDLLLQGVHASPVVGRLSVGVTLVLRDRLTVTYTHALSTPEFREQGTGDGYGELSVSIAW